MKNRIISGVIIAALLAALVFCAHIPFVLNVVIAAISAAALYETLIVTKYIESKALMGVSIFISLFVPFLAPLLKFIAISERFSISSSVISVVFVYILVVFISMLVSGEKFSLEHISFVFLMTLIIPCFFSTIIYSYGFSGGVLNILLIFLCAWGSDTGGYIFGRLFGRHQFAPHISPKKTIEGVIGCIISSVSVVIILAYVGDVFFDEYTVNYVSAAFCGVFGGICAILGDLFASVIKRSFGVKDFGSIIPGHGGIMDRFDSVLFAAPFIYIIISTFPVFA